MEIDSNDSLSWTQKDYYFFYGFNEYCHEKMFNDLSVTFVEEIFKAKNRIVIHESCSQ